MLWNRKRIIFFVMAAGIVSLVIIGTSCRHKAQQNEETPAVAVAVAPVAKGTIEQAVTLTGELKPTEQVDLSAKIAGRLERLALDDGTAVAEGTFVGANQVVAVLEHNELSAQLQRATAAVQMAEAMLKQTQADMEEKQRDKVRLENLYKEDAATEKQKDQAATMYAVAAAAAESAKAGLSETEAAKQQAEVMLAEAFIRSPLTGVVSRKYVDVGNMVGPAVPLASILPMEKLKLLLDVPTRYLATVDTQKADIRLLVDAYPDKTFATKIEKIYPAINPQTRTFTMELSVSNEKADGSYLLRPGMYVTAQIVLRRLENVIVVPSDCLIRLSGKYLAFVVEGNIARRRDLEIGLSGGNMTEVKSGLEAGQMLVVIGQHKLTDNTPVEVTETNSGAERTGRQ